MPRPRISASEAKAWKERTNRLAALHEQLVHCVAAARDAKDVERRRKLLAQARRVHEELVEHQQHHEHAVERVVSVALAAAGISEPDERLSHLLATGKAFRSILAQRASELAAEEAALARLGGAIGDA